MMGSKQIWMFLLVMLALACNQPTPNSKPAPTDTPKQGTIYISVDESFKPVVEEQIKVYQSSNPEAHIIASYKSQVDCFRDLKKDSTRMIIVDRGLTSNEYAYYQGELSFNPQYAAMAYDAIAVVVNANSNDTVFTIKKIASILDGSTTTTAIMDGNNATSTVRLMQDSILRGKPFGKNVVAVAGSEAVLEAVAKSENAIGFVGLSWIGNNYDPKQLAWQKKVKLALLECVKCDEKGVFAKPSQATITFAQYPLARPLFYILKENVTGLGTGFVGFLTGERGQLIFRRSALAPAKINFRVRKSNI
jgi:phosphate transport system substrate-binding protein